MPASIFLACRLGPPLIVVGLALPLRRQTFKTIIEEFQRSPALLYLVGSFRLLAGLAIILVHNLWVTDWRLIITLIGWLTMIRGLLIMFLSEQIAAIGARIIASRTLVPGAAAIDLLIGITLCYFGYLV